jgi:pimeloyl-ACP methyl ester carboxylesterase
MAITQLDLDERIFPLDMNGLHGRMLRLPPRRKKREILLVYGHHASIERMAGLAEELNKYGAVTLPDLPGFGGMTSFYKIHREPTLDHLADYLASFVKFRYKRQRFSVMAMSFGFVVVTRMLQKYPEIAGQVDVLVSLVGFVHKDDFKFSRRTMFILRASARLLSLPVTSWLWRHIALSAPVIRASYLLVADQHSKLKDASREERDSRIDFEIQLWQMNEVRTYWKTTSAMANLDLCGKRVDTHVYHVAVENDRYFNNEIVEQHMRVVFADYTLVPSVLPAHAPTVVATAKDAAPFIPKQVRDLLSKSDAA